MGGGGSISFDAGTVPYNRGSAACSIACARRRPWILRRFLGRCWEFAVRRIDGRGRLKLSRVRLRFSPAGRFIRLPRRLCAAEEARYLSFFAPTVNLQIYLAGPWTG